MEPSPKFSFPSRADLERGCMPDGSLLRFPSRELDGERWPAPLPGKSTVTATAKKQDAPEDCGSIYTPPKGSLPYTGVPCPVPEAPDASYQRRVEQGVLDQEEWAYNQMAANNRFQAQVIELGSRAAQILIDHPEIVREDLEQSAPPGRAGEVPEQPRCSENSPGLPAGAEPRKRHVPTDEEICADAQAQGASLDQMMECAREDAAHEEQVARGDQRERTCETHDVSQEGPVSEECSSCVEEKSESKPESVKNACADKNAAPPNDTGEGARATRPHSFRIPSHWRGGIFARCSALIALAARISPRRNNSINEQLELGRKMYARAAKTDLKNEFINDRAHAAVSGWLLHLDMAFQDLGFGGWMPFRYADQWLTFVSLTRKLLAANGMITPKGPNHWRKFLEETPEVETEDDPLKLPKSLAPTKKYAAIESISEIIQRAQKKTELDVDFRKTFNERFAMGP